MDNAGQKYEICAAIDFGTTYSGLAYSYANEKDVVYPISNWPDGTPANKVPTAVLFDKDKKIAGFGQDALDAYYEQIEDGNKEDYYFFHRFKMALHDKQRIDRKFLLEEHSGKTMKAITVFSEVIRFLKDFLISSINERSTENNLTVISVQWVLTVPAIWSYSAKLFMRKAAQKAGLPSRSLVIALEPECASLYCQTAAKDKMSLNSDFKTDGSKYLVLDNGGGTVDVTAHQILDGGNIKEIYKATGGAWGGTKVDQLFIEYLESLFSKESVKNIQENHTSYWVQLMKEFESIKKKIGSKNKDPTVSISLIGGIWEENFFNQISPDVRKGALIKGSRLRIEKTVIADMIKQVSESIKNHTQSLLKQDDLQGLDFIVMVGGFSNSNVVVKTIKDLVESSCLPVLVPEDAELAVVKGAVLYGWKQDKIVMRKARYTYGYRKVLPFNNDIHPERLAYFPKEKDNCIGKQCKNIFDTLITVNQEITANQFMSKLLIPADEDQTGISFILFVTSKEKVSYTDEEGVERIGKIKVPISDGVSNADRSVAVDMTFGSTELSVTGRNVSTGETVKASFGFL